MEFGLKYVLDDIYHRFNRRRYVDPDPLQFLYAYENTGDREIAGMIAASLAYGRVVQINKSVSWVLSRMGPSPREFLLKSDMKNLLSTFTGFVHRFAKTEHLAGLLSGLRQIVFSHGSMNNCFLSHYDPNDETVFNALNQMAKELLAGACKNPVHLVPLPERGSAGKRLHLFLRWMVRQDAVDPGGWVGVSPSKLIVPLDVHMHAVCRKMGFTYSKCANLKTALDITACFKQVSPDDPIKYDFSLTRLGIRKDIEIKEMLMSKIINRLT
ncbi:MAG: TIGR02757 family protein [Desulfobacterales bacterium]